MRHVTKCLRMVGGLVSVLSIISILYFLKRPHSRYGKTIIDIIQRSKMVSVKRKTIEFMMAPSRGKSSASSFPEVPEVGHHATPFFGQVIDLSGLKHYSNGCKTRGSAATAAGLGESHRPSSSANPNAKLVHTFGSYGSAPIIYY